MSEPTDRDKSLDPHYAREIGGLVVRFGSLEGLVATGVGMLVNADQKIGLIITSKLGFDQRLAILDALVRAKSDVKEVIEALEKLSARLRTLQQKRNEIVHAMWIQRKDGTDAPYLYRYNARLRKGAAVQNVEKVTPDEIGDIAEEAGVAFHQTCAFLVDLVERGLAFDHGVNSGDKPTRSKNPPETMA